MNNEYIHDRMCIYLEKNGIEIDKVFPFRLRKENDDIIISEWNAPIEKPTKKQLKEITKEDIKKHNLKKEKAKLKNDRLYPLIDRLCKKLGVNINELIDEL